MYYYRGDHILCFYSSHYLHFLFHFLHGLKQELKTLACCWCMGLHRSVGRALQQFCRGFWRMMARFRGMLLKYLLLHKDNFLEFHQLLHAVIDLTLRWRILVTMFRISRLCPSVISILKVWKSLSLHLMWGHFDKSRTITQQIGINFPEKDFKIYSHRQANHLHTQLEHDFRHVSTLTWKHRYFPKCLEKHLFYKRKKFASLFFNHIFIKEKNAYECGERFAIFNY